MELKTRVFSNSNKTKLKGRENTQGNSVSISAELYPFSPQLCSEMKTEVIQAITTEAVLKGGLQSPSESFFPALHVKPPNETCISTFQKRSEVLSTLLPQVPSNLKRKVLFSPSFNFSDLVTVRQKKTPWYPFEVMK